ncbi:endonuclease III [Sporolactobacillus shoreicorticis]|uniref:Endonuclease III n=1 Tax=Sporolactobacillus shoreicorticis TaxID=1923877 RepID=A0ABW5S6H4_9BACL|nr:endonuclease III [Sporolactobacillus shoreicorticis]MCO7125769.1 endonuclease III [Sporolactobacillus shoreicorticis]
MKTIADMFPDAHCELNHSNPFELAIAVMLSAQCTDALVNRVTPALFQKYHEPEDYLAVSVTELQHDIRSIGLYRNKAKHIRQMCQMLIENYGGVLPTTRDELIKLPGIGRKTANVIVSVAFDEPALAVDTHVERVTKRLGICRWKDSVLEVERTLMRRLPREKWSETHHRLIFFGRYHCKAQHPNCPECPLLDICREGRKRMRRGEGDFGKIVTKT